MQHCDAFAIYLSRHSLGSLWVDKELDRAGIRHQPLVIVDGTDMDFLRLLQSYSYWGQGDVSLLRPIAESTAPTKGTAHKNWLCRYEEHARQLNRLPLHTVYLATITQRQTRPQRSVQAENNLRIR